jgi:hypothetical protein
MDEKTEILIRILAQTDATWLPQWSYRPPATTNYYFARLDFCEGRGVPWSSGGGDEAGRKAAQRTLESLASDGLIKVIRPRRSKALACELTEEGEAHTRRLLHLPGLDGGFSSIEELRRLTKARPKLLTDAWIWEGALVGDVGDDPKQYTSMAWTVRRLMLPALIRRWVVSDASVCEGVPRTYYLLLKAGFDRLRGPAPPDVVFKGKVDQAADQLYSKTLETELHRLETAEPRNRNELGLFGLLPVAIEGLKWSGEWPVIRRHRVW